MMYIPNRSLECLIRKGCQKISLKWKILVNFEILGQNCIGFQNIFISLEYIFRTNRQILLLISRKCRHILYFIYLKAKGNYLYYFSCSGLSSKNASPLPLNDVWLKNSQILHHDPLVWSLLPFFSCIWLNRVII